MDELVSVIVPVYNVEKYLEKCINSIIAQTYRNIEILLINDGSTDRSADVLEELKEVDSRIKVFSQENAGLSAARNKGIENARGKYYVFVDSDDYIRHDMVEILYRNLVDYKADISVCDFYWIFEDEIVDESVTNDVFVYEGKNVVRKLIRDDVISVVAWNKLYKAELFDNLRYPVGRLHEDEYVIHILLQRCYRSVYTNAKLYYYIKRKGSITNDKGVKYYFDIVTARSQRLKWAIEYGDKKFANWCFDSLINEGDAVLRRNDLSNYSMTIDKIKNIIRQTLDSIGFTFCITWRKIVVGYIWLNNPELSRKVRRILHC